LSIAGLYIYNIRTLYLPKVTPSHDLTCDDIPTGMMNTILNLYGYFTVNYIMLCEA